MREPRTTTKALLPLICAAALCVAAGTAAAANSGFLPDYSKLQPVKNEKGKELMRWISPTFKKGVYTKVLIDRVTFYPAPKATDQVSDKALADIQAYLDSTLRNVVLKDVPQATEPGPGVLELKVAITAVDTSASGLKPWQVIPVALVVQGAKAATGTRAMDATLNVEGIASDSVTHEPQAMIVRQAKGVQLENAKEQLTLDLVKPKLDQWAASAAQFVAEKMGAAK